MSLDLHSLLSNTLAKRTEVSDFHLGIDEPVRLRAWGALSVLRAAPLNEGELVGLVERLCPALAATGSAAGGLQRLLAPRLGGCIDFAGFIGGDAARAAGTGCAEAAEAAGAVDGVRLRGNLHLRAAGSLGLALRRLRDTIPELDGLGLPALLPRLVDRSRGLLLVTGPAGSGKSTTLAALVRHLVSSRPLHVLTIEDPIEYRMDLIGANPGSPLPGLVTARQIGDDTDDFAAAVRAAMRQGPDVIVIGEIRDRATMHAALAAGESGHLVLATLHTPNASEAVERVLSFFPPDEMGWVRSVLANVLIAVLSQALVRKRGAPAFALVCELLVNTPAVRQQIQQGTSGQLRGIMAQGRRDGHLQMTAQLVERVRRGEIDEDDARHVACPAEEFLYLMQSSAGRGA